MGSWFFDFVFLRWPRWRPRWDLVVLAITFALSTSVRAESITTIAINRDWEVLDPSEHKDPRVLLKQAAVRLKNWTIYIDAVPINGSKLRLLARSPAAEPILRFVRETLRRPLDLEDFLYFLDDLLLAGKRGLRGKLIWISASRARKAGIFIHPDDVFKNKSRNYGESTQRLAIDKPQRPARLPPAKDGEILGPRWCSRYPNPSGRRRKLAALNQVNPARAFGNRVASLMSQLKSSGATVLLYSTKRDPRRGYLMWGAFSLSRLETETQVEKQLAELARLNAEWKRNVPIRWRHPGGFSATIEAARKMADSYMVVYATKAGAQSSSHYNGTAVDLTVFGLPRTVRLKAPDGARRVFDLSDPNQTRDLSLTPAMIDWIEDHFGFSKLRSDYPHWDDNLSTTD